MTALAVLPPDAFIGVEESMADIVARIEALLASGAAYPLSVLDGPGHDVYLDLAQVADFGRVSGWSRDDMLAVYADRGATRTVWASVMLDPLLWRAARPGEPTWEGASLGAGRPGGTSSAPPSPWNTWACPSTSAAAVRIWSSRITR